MAHLHDLYYVRRYSDSSQGTKTHNWMCNLFAICLTSQGRSASPGKLQKLIPLTRDARSPEVCNDLRDRVAIGGRAVGGLVDEMAAVLSHMNIILTNGIKRAWGLGVQHVCPKYNPNTIEEACQETRHRKKATCPVCLLMFLPRTTLGSRLDEARYH